MRPPDARSLAIRALGAFALATALLPPGGGAVAGEVVARFPLGDPAPRAVQVEREPDGTLRVILEYPPPGPPGPGRPAPTPDPQAPAPETIEEMVDLAVAAVPADRRAQVLDAVAKATARVLNQERAYDLATTVDLVSGWAIGFMGGGGAELAPQIADLAGALYLGPPAAPVGERLAELSRAVERRRMAP